MTENSKSNVKAMGLGVFVLLLAVGLAFGSIATSEFVGRYLIQTEQN